MHRLAALLYFMPRRVLMLVVRGYRFLLSPWLGSACRFEPTCSAYALAALERHGAAAGSLLTLGRLARCHPWCDGGHDPVPAEGARPIAGLFTGLLRLPAERAPTSLPFREKNLP